MYLIPYTTHALEEEDFQFSRMFPDHDGWARLDGYCCATYAYGGDCTHTMTPEVPEVELCPIDGRPVPPWE